MLHQTHLSGVSPLSKDRFGQSVSDKSSYSDYAIMTSVSCKINLFGSYLCLRRRGLVDSLAQLPWDWLRIFMNPENKFKFY